MYIYVYMCMCVYVCVCLFINVFANLYYINAGIKYVCDYFKFEKGK